MEKKHNSIDPDFIARPAEPPRSSNTRALERKLSSLPAPPVPALPIVPDVFDEARIKYEMSRLAGTPGFSKYVAMLKSKFSRSMERKVLEH